MAQQFGTYAITLPLGTTWEERIRLLDNTGTPRDLTGFEPRMQVRDEDGALVLDLSATEIEVEAPATDGYVKITVTPSRVNLLSPDNEPRLLFYDIDLRDASPTPGEDPYIIPALKGTVFVQSRITAFP